MIGGYLYRKIDEKISARLKNKLEKRAKTDLWDYGFFFCSHSGPDGGSPFAASPDTTAVSEDLLVGSKGNSAYAPLDLQKDFLDLYRKNGAEAFDAIQCDFRMAVASRTDAGCRLMLASHRAGAGRMYYHTMETGILFSSDLRFLLEIIPMDVDFKGIYSILKYGMIPEPLTISRNISSVPAAHYLNYDLISGEHAAEPFFQFRFDFGAGSVEASLGNVRSALKKSAAFMGGRPSAMLLSGGIDSSLYGCYLNEAKREPLQAFYCAFGPNDPERPFAGAIAKKMGVELNVAAMEKSDALQAVDDAVRFADHPFSDFSSLPIVFLLKFIRERLDCRGAIVECNGGDDCFGFGALADKSKFLVKHSVPNVVKKAIAASLKNLRHWKWESCEGVVARIAALADVHEKTFLNYFLVQAPVYYLGLNAPPEWDETLQDHIERISRSCSESHHTLGYEEKITVRQLLFVNSHLWTAKALSVSESLGLRVLYPFIWRDILIEQGKLPWSAKVRDGVVKWPLKKLLEEYMPADFIYRNKSGFVPPLVRWLTDPEFNSKVRDVVARKNGFVSQVIPVSALNELLSDALSGKRLRFPLLNTLWGAIFTEFWIREHQRIQP